MAACMLDNIYSAGDPKGPVSGPTGGQKTSDDPRKLHQRHSRPREKPKRRPRLGPRANELSPIITSRQVKHIIVHIYRGSKLCSNDVHSTKIYLVQMRAQSNLKFI